MKSSNFLHITDRVSIILMSAAFLIYVAATISIVLALVLHFEPRYGQTNILVYIGICSLMGSLTVSIFICELSWENNFLVSITLFLKPNFRKYSLDQYSGREHKSNWNSNKTYTGGNKPNYLSSDLVLCYCCCNLCYHSAKLP